MDSKICTKCGKTKPLSDFGNIQKGTGKKRSACKECLNQYQKEWQQKNKEKVSGYGREYYGGHKEEIKARSVEWRRTPAGKECSRKYREEHKEELTLKRNERLQNRTPERKERDRLLRNARQNRFRAAKRAAKEE